MYQHIIGKFLHNKKDLYRRSTKNSLLNLKVTTGVVSALEVVSKPMICVINTVYLCVNFDFRFVYLFHLFLINDLERDKS